MRRKTNNRGFSVTELLVVTGIVALAGALAMPRFSTMAQHGKLDRCARELMVTIKRSRSIAVAGKVIEQGPPPVKSRVAGIRVDTPTRYAVFVDPDFVGDNYNEVDLFVVDLTDLDPQGRLRIAAPQPGAQIRFLRNGTTQPQTIVVTDVESRRNHRLELTAGGQVRMSTDHEENGSSP